MVWDEEARNKTLPGSHGARNGVKRRAGAPSSRGVGDASVKGQERDSKPLKVIDSP